MLYVGHRTWRKFMGLFRTPESNCLSACQILNEMNHIEESLLTLYTAFPSTVLPIAKYISDRDRVSRIFGGCRS